MKEDNIDIELEPGLDGADTRDSDDPGANDHDDCIRAKRKRASRKRTPKPQPQPKDR